MKKMLLVMMAVCFMGIMFPVSVRAEEVTELSQIMIAENETSVRQMPNEQGEIVHTYDSGAPVYVTGKTDNGWYRVLYQDIEGYVPVSELIEQNIDIAGLDREMEVVEEESKLVIEEVERYRAENKRSKIWGAVIILLVAGIFATGIFSTLKSGKEEKKDD